jgi:hypothetical protein
MPYAAGKNPDGSNVYSNAVDLLTLCPAGHHSIVGSTRCATCGLGRANAFVGQVECACCAAGTFANVSGLSHCFPCPNTFSGCNQQCTSNPSCSCSDDSKCDVNRCAAGCTFQNETTCEQAPAGSYTRCGTPSNCSASANELVACTPGRYSPAIGAFLDTTCTPCDAGSYCPQPGMAASVPCNAGSFSKSNATQCELCRAGTFAADDRSLSCSSCPPGSSCPEGASRPCICPINQYSSEPGAAECSQCPGQAVPLMGRSECVSHAAPTGSDVLLYKSIIVIFGIIALGSVVLVVVLVRSRHTFTVRPFHSGICIYIASFAPYALLKSVAVSKLLKTENQTQELTAEFMLSGTFMIFFCLGFGGKMALIQMWMHLISRHTSGGSEQSLMASARQTWKFMRLTVLVVCMLYIAGFVALVGVFAQASIACAAAADSTSCIALSLNGTVPGDCQQQIDLTRGITYYEGLFAAVVAVVFTFYALLFNGLAYALLTSDATFSNLTRLQRMLISNKLLRWMMSPCERARYQCDPPCV